MQHYINLGIGFNAEHLTKSQCDLLNNNPVSVGNYSIEIVPFTENYEGHKWATVVFIDLGEISSKGKMASVADINADLSKRTPLSANDTNGIAQVLAKAGLSHLMHLVEPIIYSYEV